MPSMYKGKPNNEKKGFIFFTPDELSEFISEKILNIGEYKEKKDSLIVYDICCGEGSLIKPFLEKGIQRKNVYLIDTNKEFLHRCIADISIPKKNTYQINFLFYENWFTQGWPNPDLILCNPPFNGHLERLLYPEEFLKKIFSLYGNDIPLVLFAPVGLRCNKSCYTKSGLEIWKWYSENVNISSIISLQKDVFPDSKGFYSEILLINFSGLDPHYFFYYEKKLKNILKKY